MSDFSGGTPTATLVADVEDDVPARERLCSSCKKLNFSTHKFVISPEAAFIPPVGGPEATGSDHHGFLLSSGNARRVLATWSQIQDRHIACRFCDLVYQAVQRCSSDRVENHTELFLSWEVDGREMLGKKSEINRTRRIRLSWNETDGKEETVYIVFVAPSGSRRLNSDANANMAKNTHFLGRGLANTNEKQALMKSWIDLCVKEHKTNCDNRHGARSEFTKLVKGTYFGVIDVIDMQLKELPIEKGVPENYVALSYVWGNRPGAEKPYVTTRANVMLHIQHGGLEKAWEKLPRTIQDVILLVSRLGQRYVWIDSLCIVQDSASSWELNAKAMHLVYGNAHFTICAADGDADDGLVAVDPILRNAHPIGPSPKAVTKRPQGGSPSRPPISSQNIPARDRQAKVSSFPNVKAPPFAAGLATEESRGRKRAVEEAHSPPITAEVLPGIRLLVSRPPEAVISNSSWNQRGWTFQERLLSRRCLIFAEGKVFFQCRSTVISQHIFTDGGANSWSLDWTNSPLRTLGELRRRAFWFYMKCVHLYTGRSLTKPKDVLTAFEGVSWLLKEHMKAPLFWGLPMSHFDLALLWMPLAQLDRRRRKGSHNLSSACTQDLMGNCRCKQEEEGYGVKEFPSWSWSGWQGGKAEYKPDMIEGSLINVQEWLRDHTWIQWYLRDFEGNLRPLWDKDVLQEDVSGEVRWRGYAGRSPPRVRVQTMDSSSESSSAESSAANHRFSRESTLRRERDLARSLRAPSSPLLTTNRWSRQSNVEYLKRLPAGYYDEDIPGDDDHRETRESRVEEPEREPSKRERESLKAERLRVNHPNARLPVPPAAQPLPTPSMMPYYGMQAYGQPVYQQQPYGDPSTAFSAASNVGYGPHYYQAGTPMPFPGYPYGSAPPVPLSPPRPPRAEIRIREASGSRGRHDGRRDPSFHPEEERPRHVPSRNHDKRSGPYDSDEEDMDIHITLPRRSPDSQEFSVRSQRKDSYGRPHRPNLDSLNTSIFTGILPDNPFGVARGPFPKDTEKHGQGMPILQFLTWRTELFVTIRPGHTSVAKLDGVASNASAVSSNLPQLGSTMKSAVPSELIQCDISDKSGDWCGAIILPSSWIANRQAVPMQFIALSDAKTLTNEECPVWNYYIPKEKEESEWDLYYVMLLQRNRERAVWERVAIGKVFQAAFRDSAWDEIKLG